MGNGGSCMSLTYKRIKNQILEQKCISEPQVAVGYIGENQSVVVFGEDHESSSKCHTYLSQLFHRACTRNIRLYIEMDTDNLPMPDASEDRLKGRGIMRNTHHIMQDALRSNYEVVFIDLLYKIRGAIREGETQGLSTEEIVRNCLGEVQEFFEMSEEYQHLEIFNRTLPEWKPFYFEGVKENELDRLRQPYRREKEDAWGDYNGPTGDPSFNVLSAKEREIMGEILRRLAAHLIRQPRVVSCYQRWRRFIDDKEVWTTFDGFRYLTFIGDMATVDFMLHNPKEVHVVYVGDAHRKNLERILAYVGFKKDFEWRDQAKKGKGKPMDYEKEEEAMLPRHVAFNDPVPRTFHHRSL
jgi:hypothetical protein